jgi:hypothetical protein
MEDKFSRRRARLQVLGQGLELDGSRLKIVGEPNKISKTSAEPIQSPDY